MKIFSTASVKRIDAYTIEHEPISSLMLMERAAAALTRAVLASAPNNSPFAVFAGPGNNGGDALAVARMLAVAGRTVGVWAVSPGDRLSPDCAANLKSLQAMEEGGFPVVIHSVKEAFAAPEIPADAVIIDGLFGSGLSRPVEGVFASVIHYINRCPNTVFAIDLPSGLMGEDNGANAVDNIVRADRTFTLQFPKLAMLFAENERFVGAFEVLDISLSKEAMDAEPTSYYMVDKTALPATLPKRGKHAHKGQFGRLLLVAGSEGMAGASILAGRAALRSGVGLLTMHIPRCNNPMVQSSVPEAMTSLDGCTTHISAVPYSDKYTAVAVGPGLGGHRDTEKALLEFIGACHVPLLLDADALNILSRNKEYLTRLPQGSVITPHVGEFDRLAGDSKDSYDRLQKAMALAVENRLCVVLKGAYTAVISPQGDCFFNASGNPGMATGGSGDVLTGVIAALLAQGLSTLDAARLGVYIHGAAGDFAAETVGETALIASDIIDALPRALLDLKKQPFSF